MDENSVKSLLEAARWAPSCFGDQPWKFVIFHKKDASMWAKALNCLSVGNQNWAMDTSLLICVCANKNFKHNDNENKWAKYDSGAASENICLQSTYLGLAAHQMGGFDSDKIRNLANIPVEFDVVSFIAVGKPLAEDLLSNEQHEAEGAKRKRLKLSEIYFENEWNNFKG
jgi:nitroreductase